MFLVLNKYRYRPLQITRNTEDISIQVNRKQHKVKMRLLDKIKRYAHINHTFKSEIYRIQSSYIQKGSAVDKKTKHFETEEISVYDNWHKFIKANYRTELAYSLICLFQKKIEHNRHKFIKANSSGMYILSTFTQLDQRIKDDSMKIFLS